MKKLVIAIIVIAIIAIALVRTGEWNKLTGKKAAMPAPTVTETHTTHTTTTTMPATQSRVTHHEDHTVYHNAAPTGGNVIVHKPTHTHHMS